ncbi:MAG: sodium-dependent transporter [Clostridia bacterium]|nr:sodium-dependent transporter [Clostridia bacterium]
MEEQRGQWGSTFGFLMAAIGSAVGLGNIWGFPYKMGKCGGGAFLLVYLLLVIFVGFATMLGELALGRKYGRGAVGTYAAIGKKWTWVGYMGVASGFFILAFYSVLGGMVLRYMIGFIMQIFGGSGFEGLGGGDFFGSFTTNAAGMMAYYAIFMAVNIIIVAGGIEGGIEKFTKIAMPALAAILIVVIIYVACQPGAGEGYKFAFVPDFSILTTDFFTVLKTAAGQMFFSLSLGMGCMITYGSYLGKEQNLESNMIIIPIADTCFAICAAMAVLPACAAFGQEYGAGPGLLFITLHEVFNVGMGGFIGNLMGFLFYFLVFLAAITSSISLLEVCTAYLIDKQIEKGKEPDRKKLTITIAAIIFLVGIPVALDGLGAGRAGGAVLDIPATFLGVTENIPMAIDCWLDFYDCISEGIMMPLGAAIMSIIIGWVIGTKVVADEVAETPGVKLRAVAIMDICFKFIVPAIMVVVLIAQIQDFF